MQCMLVGIRSNSYLLRDICSLRSRYYAFGDTCFALFACGDIYFVLLAARYLPAALLCCAI